MGVFLDAQGQVTIVSCPIWPKFEYLKDTVSRKPVFGVSDQVQHNPGCSTTEDGPEELDISDLGSRGIVLSV